MRSLVLVLSFLAIPALAQDAAPAPDAPASAPGHAEFKDLQCKGGRLSFHFRSDGYTDGRVAIPLQIIAMVCRQAQREEQEDAPQQQRMPQRPLPKADNV